eukprot:NODE_48_length_31852_cov_1.054168.p20 type:complete len:153 gc:universal NODE_48_length_31852_cov_1.054168:17235-17693(+)
MIYIVKIRLSNFYSIYKGAICTSIFDQNLIFTTGLPSSSYSTMEVRDLLKFNNMISTGVSTYLKIVSKNKYFIKGSLNDGSQSTPNFLLPFFARISSYFFQNRVFKSRHRARASRSSIVISDRLRKASRSVCPLAFKANTTLLTLATLLALK